VGEVSLIPVRGLALFRDFLRGNRDQHERYASRTFAGHAIGAEHVLVPAVAFYA